MINLSLKFSKFRALISNGRDLKVLMVSINFKVITKIVLLLLIHCSVVYSQETVDAFSQKDVDIWQKDLRSSKHDSIKLKSCTNLAYWNETINIDTTLYYLQKGSIFSERLPKHRFNLPYLMAFGNYYATIKDNTKATLYYQKARDLAYEINNKDFKKIATYNLITSRYFNVGKYSLAIKALFNFKELLDSDKNTENYYYIALYENLSICYSVLNNIDKSKEFTQKILERAQNKSDTLSYYNRQLEILSKDANQFNESKLIYNKGILLAQKAQNIEMQLILYNLMAEACINSKKFESAIYFASLEEKLALKNNFSINILFAQSIFGQAYLGLKQYNKAKIYFSKAIPLYKKTETKDGLLVALKGMAKSHQELGQYKESLRYYLEANKLQEDIFGKEKQIIAEELNIQYQTTEKEKQIAAKDLNIKVQQAATKSQEQQKNLIIGLLCLTFIVALWALWNYRKQNKLSLALAEEKQVVEKQALQMVKLNHTKDKLFAIIGHDLRSPVAGLQVVLNEIEEYKGYDIQQKVHALKGGVAGLYNTLNNLLHWAKIQMKEEDVSLTELDLKNEIEETLELLSFQINTKKIVVLNQVQKEAIIQFNEQNLQAILRNILSNAIKFTQEGGYIKLSTEVNAQFISLNIKDTGVGMAEQVQQALFNNPKSRVGTNGEHGTGLGLKLCKEIMESNNGSISIKSEVNIGTVVTLKFIC